MKKLKTVAASVLVGTFIVGSSSNCFAEPIDPKELTQAIVSGAAMGALTGTMIASPPTVGVGAPAGAMTGAVTGAVVTAGTYIISETVGDIVDVIEANKNKNKNK